MYKRDVAAAKVEVTEECNAGGREGSCRWEGGIMQVESRGRGGRGRGRMRKVKGEGERRQDGGGKQVEATRGMGRVEVRVYGDGKTG